jgi:hypothetical protein
MARDPIVTYNPSESGTTMTYLAAVSANGASIAVNNGKILLIAQNAGGAPVNVTIKAGQTINGLTIQDRIVAVPASGMKVIGPFAPGIYNQAGTDTLYVDVSGNINLLAIQQA